VEERADPPVVAVIKERIDLAADRVLHDCIALGAPAPEFLVRVGREPLEGFDARYPDLIPGFLAEVNPAGVIVHVSIPPDRSSSAVRCTLEHTVEALCLVLAENVQQLLIEGELWGAAWPPCPIHGGGHPLWAEPAKGTPTWTCSEPPGFSAAVGTLRSR
jgi:hypothetical protein